MPKSKGDSIKREEKQYIVWLFEHGYSLKDICAISDRSRWSVEKIAAELGIRESDFKEVVKRFARKLFDEDVKTCAKFLGGQKNFYPLPEEIRNRYMNLAEPEALSYCKEKYDELMWDAPEFTYETPTLEDVIGMVKSGEKNTILTDMIYQAIIDGELILK
jgi:hypothetical protein